MPLYLLLLYCIIVYCVCQGKILENVKGRKTAILLQVFSYAALPAATINRAAC